MTDPLLRLDLGCGKTPRAGFEGVDCFEPTAKHQVDLCRFPWPWADGSVAELSSSHFLEHLPMAYIEVRGPAENSGVPSITSLTPDGGPGRKDLLCRFMDEAFRVLAPGGKFHIEVPSARSDRAFQDPTHRRFFVEDSFRYFSAAWRNERGLGHYLCECDFEVQTAPVVPKEVFILPEGPVKARRIASEWNATSDIRAVLTSLKKAPPKRTMMLAPLPAGMDDMPEIRSLLEKAALEPARKAEAPNVYRPEPSTRAIIAIDDFADDPDQLRARALRCEFAQDRGGAGCRTAHHETWAFIPRALGHVMGGRIDMVGASWQFHYAPAGTPEVFHADDAIAQWGAVLFLTPNAPLESGTALLRHKATGKNTGDPGAYSKHREAPFCYMDPTEWEEEAFIGNVYNRMVIFPAHRVHTMRKPFGSNANDARLTQLFFFNVHPTEKS